MAAAMAVSRTMTVFDATQGFGSLSLHDWESDPFNNSTSIIVPINYIDDSNDATTTSQSTTKSCPHPKPTLKVNAASAA